MSFDKKSKFDCQVRVCFLQDLCSKLYGLNNYIFAFNKKYEGRINPRDPVERIAHRERCGSS